MARSEKSSFLPLIIFLVVIVGIAIYGVSRYIPGKELNPALEVTGRLSKADVEVIVKDVIRQNPEIIVEALTTLQAKKEQEMLEKSKQALQDKRQEIENNENDPTAGNPNADVTIVEFFDYYCGYCRKVTPVVAELLKIDPNVRVIFKEYPILTPLSQKSAQIALAVNRLDKVKYVDFHNALMASESLSSESEIIAVAEKVGIDSTALKQEMEKSAVSNQIAANLNLGRQIGVQGTPAFLIGGELIPGAVSLETLKEKVAEVRNAKLGTLNETNDKPAAPTTEGNNNNAAEHKGAPAIDNKPSSPVAPAPVKEMEKPSEEVPALPTMPAPVAKPSVGEKDDLEEEDQPPAE